MRRILTFLFLAAACQATFAQSLRQCFIDMPDSISPLLTRVNREDFLDFMDSGMKAEVTNRLGSTTRMTVLEEDLIVLNLTSETTLQLKMLPLRKKDRVICAVSTMGTDAQDSGIRFYSADWTPLDAGKYLGKPLSLSDFLDPQPRDASDEVRQAYAEADILFLRADFEPGTGRLIMTCTTLDYVSKDAAGLLAPYFHPSITLEWVKGKGFRRI